MQPKYPNIKAKLTGKNGNALMILGTVSLAMKRANIPQAEIDAYRKEALDGDYNHVLQTSIKWIDVS